MSIGKIGCYTPHMRVFKLWEFTIEMCVLLCRCKVAHLTSRSTSSETCKRHPAQRST